MPTFRLTGLDPEPFALLFLLDDARLRALGARRHFADADHGFPCRVSLEDARCGDELLLLPYEHQPADSPYRASGPIFFRRHATRRVLEPGVVPPYVTRRLISLRAYDATRLMVDADACEGEAVATCLERLFAAPAVAYIHLHNARRGCYSCTAERA